MATLPLPTDPELTHFDLQVVLDGATYTLEFYWNDRDSGWFMDVRTEDGTPIRTSIRVTVGLPLAARARGVKGMPPGALLAVDTSGEGRDPGLGELGSRVQLEYFEVGGPG
jgi:hypothetical protein